MDALLTLVGPKAEYARSTGSRRSAISRTSGTVALIRAATAGTMPQHHVAGGGLTGDQLAGPPLELRPVPLGAEPVDALGVFEALHLSGHREGVRMPSQVLPQPPRRALLSADDDERRERRPGRQPSHR
jgi:hypothetical protein